MILTLKSKTAKLLVTLLLITTSFVVNAQTNTTILSGKVVDENQEPLLGATVSIKNAHKATATDFEGAFRFKVTVKKQTLQISHIGYKTLEQEVIAGTQNLVFTLVKNNTVLDEVLVSATRANEKTPITFTNIDKEDLKPLNLGQDLPILLDQLTSVVTTSDAGAGVGYTGLRVRGSDASRINVTLNGIPYNDAESQGTFWVNMPDFSSSIEDIQLQRGVGTSTNGVGAFGAS